MLLAQKGFNFFMFVAVFLKKNGYKHVILR